MHIVFMNHYLNELEKERRYMDESGMGEEVSADENIAFWIVVIALLACLCAIGCWLYEMAGVV